ncbi:hypothetical protein scyTo_0007339 [Scyliorhinus torazame]|uniref:Uncharacterized protein n=1 Tax=Scyliorhinus torazame TaxID=75743 RepID=A0A401NQI1_SCYTO|nr:hypothetical protein [Scyliorhinus torazame]
MTKDSAFSSDLEELYYFKKQEVASGKQSSLLTDGLNDKKIVCARIALAEEEIFSGIQQERRMEKDSLLRSHSDDVKALAFQSQQREQELTERIQQMEAQHDKTVNELEILLSSQNTLINKLKTECHNLNQKLQKITEKNRSEIGQLCQDKEYLQERIEKLQARNDEMENQCIQHGTMHERMKQRLQQLDQHSQASAKQVLELLQRQNELLKERQTLLEKVQCLKSSGNVTGKPPVIS